jgi:hypothetical protein
MATTNGMIPQEHTVLEELLTQGPLTSGYRATLPLWALYSSSEMPQIYLYRDIELMLIHPIVRNVLEYYKGGISMVEFEGSAETPEVEEFVLEQGARYWDRGIVKLQGGYEYGWMGCECLYTDDEGPLRWDDFVQFSPRDVFLLTQDYEPVGVRVKQVRSKGQVDLWLGNETIPGKAIWYAHNPRYNSFYGQSQLMGAWRPWRRLAWKDAAETVVDTGVYRFAYAGPVVRYPEEDLQVAASNIPATSLDSQGRPRRYARDLARQIAEWLKAGAGVGMPSTKYAVEMGGGDKWAMELPKSTLDVQGLIAYVQYLSDQISYGIGVPPELLDSGETGSGYSGRAIPMEAFLAGQQRIADNLLNLFIRNVLKPLVRWNFGPVKWDLKLRPLLETKRKAQAGESGPAGAIAPEEGTMPQAGGVGQQDQGGWEPYVSPKGKAGWQSKGGLVRYTPNPPGSAVGQLSVDSVQLGERVRRIVGRVLEGKKLSNWTHEPGQRGSQILWVNRVTGEKRYQQDEPQDDGPARSQQSTQQQPPPQQPQSRPRRTKKIKAPPQPRTLPPGPFLSPEEAQENEETDYNVVLAAVLSRVPSQHYDDREARLEQFRTREQAEYYVAMINQGWDDIENQPMSPEDLAWAKIAYLPPQMRRPGEGYEPAEPPELEAERQRLAPLEQGQQNPIVQQYIDQAQQT